MEFQFEGVTFSAKEHSVHQLLLDNASVACGYGVSESSIRQHKSTKSDELVENKHFISVSNTDSSGSQSVTYWTARGLIRLGFFIRSERAKKFRDRIEDLITEQTSQSHSIVMPELSRLQILEMALEAEKKVIALEEENAILAPKAEYVDVVLSSKTTMTTSEIANELGLSAIALNKILVNRRIQYKKSNGRYMLYADYTGKGYIETRTHPHTTAEGVTYTEHYMVWTEKGRVFLNHLINENLSWSKPGKKKQQELKLKQG